MYVYRISAPPVSAQPRAVVEQGTFGDADTDLLLVHAYSCSSTEDWNQVPRSATLTMHMYPLLHTASD